MHVTAQTFLTDLLATSQSGWLTLSTIHPDGQHPTPSRHIRLGDQVTLQRDLAALYAANAAGWGGFFGVALRTSALGRWRRGGRHELLALPALFVDIDQDGPAPLKRLKTVHPIPSCIVHSGGGYHAYWYLDLPTREFAYAQLALAGLAQTVQGDRLTIVQSMRLPETMNHKPNRRHRRCTVLDYHPDRRYGLRQFYRYTRIVPQRTKPPRSTGTPRTSRMALSGADTHKTLNPALIAQVLHRLRSNYGGYDRQGSDWLGALCPCGHQQDRPGQHFFFNPIAGVGFCHGRHGKLLLRDLCPLLGISIAAHGGIYLNQWKETAIAT